MAQREPRRFPTPGLSAGQGTCGFVYHGPPRCESVSLEIPGECTLALVSADEAWGRAYGEPVGITRSTPRGNRRSRLASIVLIAAVLTPLIACSSAYPPQHAERLRKAAGVVTFRITCSKDLWERTRGVDTSRVVTAKSVKDMGDGVALVSLSGPQLVDYLSLLGYSAFDWNSTHDPLSERMYNAIAPEVDKIRGPLKPGDPVPEVTLNDAAVPTPSSSAAPSKPK